MNSKLYSVNVPLPKDMLDHLTICFQRVPNSDASVEGHKRNEELRDTGYVTYQQLGRIKNWFDNYEGDGTDAPFILNGADYMKNWVENTIQGLRKNDNFSNQIQNDYMPDEIDDKLIKDLGPIADMIRPSKDHSTFTQDVRIKEDLNRINQIMKKII